VFSRMVHDGERFGVARKVQPCEMRTHDRMFFFLKINLQELLN
jgi:hypothetical protein